MWFYVGLLAMGIACVIMGVLIASLKAEQGSLIEKTARLEAQAKAVRQEMDKKIASMGSTSNNVTGILKSLETLNALVLSHNRQIAAVQSEVERLRYDLEEATKPPPEQ
jgi:wobble nucleotide-excising tRNase